MAQRPLQTGEAELGWGCEAADRWVLIRGDVSCGGLWHADGSSDIAESLPPLLSDLIDRLERWACWYEQLDNANTTFPDPFYWEQRTDAPLDAFNAEGRAIAYAVKAALPADWTVEYEDVDAWLRRDAVRLVLPATPTPGVVD